MDLLDRRMTLAEHRKLLVTAGWLSLLASTSLIDLLRYPAAVSYLATAAQMAAETEHAELSAWCLETRAWLAVTTGDHPEAVRLAQAAQETAPRASSALIQATAQEGRVLARLGETAGTRRLLGKLEALVSPLPPPDAPEHHFRYDPAKAEWYIATTLAWAGDPSAERMARDVLDRMESPANGHPRPRRAVSARIDLALAMAGAGRPDEAADVTAEALASPYLAPSNFWRAEEVIGVVAERDAAAASDLRDALAAAARQPRLAIEAKDAPAG